MPLIVVGKETGGDYAGFYQIAALVTGSEDVQEGLEQAGGKFIFPGGCRDIPAKLGYTPSVPETPPGLDPEFLIGLGV